jgi:hypothetical protein
MIQNLDRTLRCGNVFLFWIIVETHKLTNIDVFTPQHTSIYADVRIKAPYFYIIASDLTFMNHTIYIYDYFWFWKTNRDFKINKITMDTSLS